MPVDSDPIKRPINATRETYARRDAQVAYVIELRKANPTVRYSELVRHVRKKFACSRQTAERSITVAQEQIRVDFLKFAAEAPRAIFDAYMDIHSEAMREKNWGQARRALDSVRDMLGIKTAPQIFVNVGPPPEAFRDLTDAQLDALAVLDQATEALAAGVIDAQSTESAQLTEGDEPEDADEDAVDNPVDPVESVDG